MWQWQPVPMCYHLGGIPDEISAAVSIERGGKRGVFEQVRVAQGPEGYSPDARDATSIHRLYTRWDHRSSSSPRRNGSDYLYR